MATRFVLPVVGRVLVTAMVFAVAPGANAEELDEKFLQAQVAYSNRVQAMALKDGRPLTAAEQEIARHFGVREVSRVRILVMDSVPEPRDPYLRAKLEEIGFLQILPRARGTTKGYGIVLTPAGTEDPIVLVHELIHVEQYERFGGIEPTQRFHLADLVAKGYRGSELEDEAFTRAAEFIEARQAVQEKLGD